MANEEQLTILGQGIEAWARWRNQSRDIPVDLSRANLNEADLSRVNLSGANLSHAYLRRARFIDADLSGAILTDADLGDASLTRSDLSNANLSGANLRFADLTDADLTHAKLNHAKLNHADLSRADLKNADLRGANLKNADLKGANLGGAEMGFAVFGSTDLNSLNLSTTKGLETARHNGPSSIGLDTILESNGKIPEVFLRGLGVPEAFIRYVPSFAGTGLEFYSCFISYSHADKAFARRLHDSLQGRGIRCWLDEKQLLPGDHIHLEIDEAVRLWDKVLLCCSEQSLTSWWVDKEVSKALKKEEQLWKERGKQVLAIIPLNLDGFLFRRDWQDWKQQHLTDRLAADLTGWEKDNAKFESQLELVIKALRADAGAREKPPKPKL